MTAAKSKVRIFLAGEGANELGSRAGHPAYQSDARPGVLQVLLTRVQPTGWEVGGARDWKSIRKLRAGAATHEDTRNVLGAVLDAKEAGCEVLVFSRDQDKDPARKDAIDEGIRRIPSTFSTGAPEVIGGVAIPVLEGWILALLGVLATESLSTKRAAEDLVAKGVPSKNGEAMARVAEDADLDKLPRDAVSLAAWLARARDVLPRKVSAAPPASKPA